MTARRFAGAVVAGALAWALVIGGAVVACDGPEQDGGAPTRIEEDDPRWDCRTMGNRTCGEGRAA